MQNTSLAGYFAIEFDLVCTCWSLEDLMERPTCGKCVEINHSLLRLDRVHPRWQYECLGAVKVRFPSHPIPPPQQLTQDSSSFRFRSSSSLPSTVQTLTHLEAPATSLEYTQTFFLYISFPFYTCSLLAEIYTSTVVFLLLRYLKPTSYPPDARQTSPNPPSQTAQSSAP
jgi:hypothetical protein